MPLYYLLIDDILIFALIALLIVTCHCLPLSYFSRVSLLRHLFLLFDISFAAVTRFLFFHFHAPLHFLFFFFFFFATPAFTFHLLLICRRFFFSFAITYDAPALFDDAIQHAAERAALRFMHADARALARLRLRFSCAFRRCCLLRAMRAPRVTPPRDRHRYAAAIAALFCVCCVMYDAAQAVRALCYIRLCCDGDDFILSSAARLLFAMLMPCLLSRRCHYRCADAAP